MKNQKCTACNGKGWIFKGHGLDEQCDLCADQEPDTPNERAAFEAWAQRGNSYLSLARSEKDGGPYFYAPTRAAWLAWQARAT